MKTLIALAAGLVVISSLPSMGQSLTWNLGGSGGVGTTGSSLSFTQSGVKVTASAWSYTKGSSNTALEASKLGQYSPGLGVVNNEEDGSSPWHQVDNFGQNDYVLFVFDKLVDITSVKVQASPGPYDQDVSYWVGKIAASTSLDNVTYSGLAALGFGSEQIVLGSSTLNAKTVGIDAPSSGVNAILFGPQRANADGSTDAFKINSITATVVPEPSAALLSLIGACALPVRRRR